jgi:hypothetical protein
MVTVRPNGFVEPCIPTRTLNPPSGPDWIHEIKHDGYRLIVRRDGDAVRLFTRRGHDWTDRYPAIARAAAKLRAKSFTTDGEAAVCGPDCIAFNSSNWTASTTDWLLRQSTPMPEIRPSSRAFSVDGACRAIETGTGPSVKTSPGGRANPHRGQGSMRQANVFCAWLLAGRESSFGQQSGRKTPPRPQSLRQGPRAARAPRRPSTNRTKKMTRKI